MVARCVTRRCFVSWNSRTKTKNVPHSRDRRPRLETPPSLPKGERRSLTPAPLRMERGVDSIVCKQRGRFFDVKRRPFHGKETPSSIERRRFFHFKILLPLYLSGIGVHVNGTIHAPLHSERGKGVRLQSRDRRPRLSAHLRRLVNKKLSV